MKIINYVGSEGNNIVITQPSDVIPLLDWCKSQMMDCQEEQKGSKNKEKWERAIDFLGELMDLTENEGISSYNKIDSIVYG